MGGEQLQPAAYLRPYTVGHAFRRTFGYCCPFVTTPWLFAVYCSDWAGVIDMQPNVPLSLYAIDRATMCLNVTYNVILPTGRYLADTTQHALLPVHGTTWPWRVVCSLVNVDHSPAIVHFYSSAYLF